MSYEEWRYWAGLVLALFSYSFGFLLGWVLGGLM